MLHRPPILVRIVVLVIALLVIALLAGGCVAGGTEHVEGSECVAPGQAQGQQVAERRPAASIAPDDAAEVAPLRLLGTADGVDPERLETAIVRCEDAQGRRVDLVAIMHFGEPSYYAELDARLRAQERVLYEHLGDVGASFAASGPVVQGAAALGLVCQLDVLDYTGDRFVHADLGTRAAEAATGLPFAEVVRRLLRPKPLPRALPSYLSAEGSHAGAPGRLSLNAEMFVVADRAARRAASAQLLQNQFERLQHGLDEGFTDLPEFARFRDARATAALAVLRRELDAGHRRVAILYGAMHVPALERRLECELGFRRTSVEWLTAWRCE